MQATVLLVYTKWIYRISSREGPLRQQADNGTSLENEYDYHKDVIALYLLWDTRENVVVLRVFPPPSFGRTL